MPINLQGNELNSIGATILNNNNIVTDGLVLYLDAGVASSYPGSGTTWTDLSGNGNNGTLVNGVSYSTANGGTLVCDGTNDYIEISTPNLISTNYTVIGAGRYITVSGRIFSARINNWLLGWWGDSGTTENYYAEGWISSVGAGAADTNWRIMAGTGNVITDQYSLYKNGSVLISNSNAGSQGPNGFSLGRYAPAGSEYSNCAIGFLLAYNRVLSDSEIIQCSNAYRKRFNI